MKKTKIIKKTHNPELTDVRDIEVAEDHHYLLANGLVSHNSGFIYASTNVVAMKKLKLKEDEDGNKISEVRGIRAACKIMKSRYAKPFETCEIKIPYDTGMDPHSGLLDLFEKKGVVVKDGNKLRYNSPVDGTEIKLFRKQFGPEHFQKIMAEFHHFMLPKADSEVEDNGDEVNADM